MESNFTTDKLKIQYKNENALSSWTLKLGALLIDIDENPTIGMKVKTKNGFYTPNDD